MSDFESFRREAGSRVMPPDFDELVATSRRRRRTAAASAIVAVAAVVSVVAFGLQGFGDQAVPVVPVGPTRSPSPTMTSTPRTTSPCQVAPGRPSLPSGTIPSSLRLAPRRNSSTQTAA